MNIIFAPLARDDLHGIGDYLSKQNPVRANSFVHELTAACDSLATWPLRSPLIPFSENRELRRRLCKGHLIIYRIRGNVVEIVRIFHGSRDYERVLFPRD